MIGSHRLIASLARKTAMLDAEDVLLQAIAQEWPMRRVLDEFRRLQSEPRKRVIKDPD